MYNESRPVCRRDGNREICAAFVSFDLDGFPAEHETLRGRQGRNQVDRLGARAVAAASQGLVVQPDHVAVLQMKRGCSCGRTRLHQNRIDQVDFFVQPAALGEAESCLP